MDASEQKKENPSKFEIQILKEMQREKQHTKSKVSHFLKNIQQPFVKASEWLKKIPGIEKVTEKTRLAVNDLLHNLHTDQFNFDGIIDKYKALGFEQISKPDDITTLNLEDIEPLIGDICKKYKTLATNEEESTSAAISIQGMPKDIVALINLNRKAVNEYAAHYGFDIGLDKERIFALNILEYAACGSEAAKRSVMERIIVQTKQMSGKTAEDYMDKTVFLSMFSKLTSAISINLLKAKIGEVLPIDGAVIGSGFNAYFTNEVCSAAQFFYKQRFLIKKYGLDVINLSEKDLMLLEERTQDENEEGFSEK
ncbi:MAG: EcsC family protein [Bacteroidota bacterium]